MQRLTCEVCGSNELIKKDGVFVCEFCGCKYSLEEIRKMMVEGTVKIDRSEESQRYFNQATELFDNELYAEASEKYAKYLESCDGDYETNFRYFLSKCYVQSAGFKEMKMAAKKLPEYAKSLAEDAKQTNKVKKLLHAVQCLDHLLVLEFNYGNNIISKDSIDKRANSCYDTEYEQMLKTSTECFDFYSLLFDQMIEVFNYFPELANYPLTTFPHWDSVYFWATGEYQDKQNSYRRFSIKNYPEAKNACTKAKSAKVKYLAAIDKVQSNAYWTSHKDEQKSLLEEKAKLEAEIQNLNAELEGISDTYQKLQLQATRTYLENNVIANELNRKKQLKEERASLEKQLAAAGTFQVALKKEIKAKIEQNGQEWNDLLCAIKNKEDEYMKSINERIRPLDVELRSKSKVIESKENALKKINQELLRKK